MQLGDGERRQHVGGTRRRSEDRPALHRGSHDGALGDRDRPGVGPRRSVGRHRRVGPVDGVPDRAGTTGVRHRDRRRRGELAPRCEDRRGEIRIEPGIPQSRDQLGGVAVDEIAQDVDLTLPVDVAGADAEADALQCVAPSSRLGDDGVTDSRVQSVEPLQHRLIAQRSRRTGVQRDSLGEHPHEFGVAAKRSPDPDEDLVRSRAGQEEGMHPGALVIEVELLVQCVLAVPGEVASRGHGVAVGAAVAVGHVEVVLRPVRHPEPPVQDHVVGEPLDVEVLLHLGVVGRYGEVPSDEGVDEGVPASGVAVRCGVVIPEVPVGVVASEVRLHEVVVRTFRRVVEPPVHAVEVHMDEGPM